jgi:multimeric flavodoxin WrbA
MKALVIYESVYGNTHLIAGAIADGMRRRVDVTVVPVDDVTANLLDASDVIIVGGPTHVHGMSRASTRKAAVEAAGKAGSPLVVESAADGPGLREWFASLRPLVKRAAAFDTRVDVPAALSGRASKGIARALRRHGATLIAEPESFLVTKGDRLVAGEEARAHAWGEYLSAELVTSAGRGAETLGSSTQRADRRRKR